MVFCNKKELDNLCTASVSHNPYFNRWFSAMLLREFHSIWKFSHNPYFNRWFSAIKIARKACTSINQVTILILIDGFLQYYHPIDIKEFIKGHNPYFNRWFSAIQVTMAVNVTVITVTILILIDGFLQF